MVLGLYYMTKARKGTKSILQGEGMTFYSPEEVEIAFNEQRVEKHAIIKVKVPVREKNGEVHPQVVETTVGRVLFNQAVPEGVGFIDEVLTKKALRNIIARIIKLTDVAQASSSSTTSSASDL